MTEPNSLHADRMAKKKANREKMMAKKTGEKGLLIVHTGPGKGKSSAAFGMVLRCVGHGMKAGVIQFIKGAWDTAERRVFESFGEQVVFKAMGEGFTWETQDRERDLAAAARAWDAAKEMVADPDTRMVVLDELNVALKYELVDLDEVIEALSNRPEGCHVVVTGRGAPEALIEAADLVTEMKLVKHPFKKGIKAQPGVEF
ncbi:cob(I)yrinic acid a,c-diamide adenosyltransferase [Magnetospira sp. QH-2]|uniref:cob(I)yrinic acid a,c-diamide adenosyltransferase n=1 Tax=Magnetospira sp. (strain QH-2) TaxID=1288970 RepID=UPI0003E80EDA|nr:cob(I)yrinic acid a,c-diamide adenosyltransferase [Magnetospira sp. QH-2]CCQ75351.1 Cob(I)yrinic acid a,c-diamide adenosyltransferase [Magnetospira sp. QH-2]